ncbi:hypothetical protein [Lewinella sp. 4G2]|uniref:hypothetical protein n=1 Tax=Lewinella sp. 4G2 TaxID=1803372 RepID=UPI0007B46B45|nr:hypothetical protein [Lewinella sp. 4G2]OAV43592.1 hypothetical protein A3850_003365 [Lewinella sp. 4G2]
MAPTSITRRLVGTGVFVFALLLQFTLTGQVWINEFHYDNGGTDQNEFVEVAGLAGTDLTTYSIVFYNGSSGTTYGTLPLTGSIDNEAGTNYGAVGFPYPGFMNAGSTVTTSTNPDGLALVKGTTVLQFLSYEGSFVATNGPANGMTSVDIGVRESSSTTANQSLQLKGTGNAATDFTWNAPSMASNGSLNAGQTIQGAAQIGTAQYPSLSAAILAATPGSTVTLLEDVTEGQFNISVGDVTVDGGGFTVTSAQNDVTDRIFEVTAPNFTLRNITLVDAPTFSLISSFGADGIVLSDITVRNSGRSGIAIACTDGATLTDISVFDTQGGLAFSITNTRNLTLTNVTTSGNSFGGGFSASIGVFSSTDPNFCGAGNTNLATDNIVVTGVVNISEPTAYYTQNVSTSPVTFNPTTVVTPAGLPFRVESPGDALFFSADAAGAIAGAGNVLLGNPGAAATLTITDTDTGNRIVAADINPPANPQATVDMSVQAAVNSIPAATPTTIQVRGGTYPEAVDYGTKEITIQVGLD